MKERIGRIKNLKDTTANWNIANPILLDGEIGVEIKPDNTVAIKIGDGKTAWKLLKYVTKTISEINAEKESLQNQIDNIVVAASDSGDVTSEVVQARVDFDGNGHSTLKNRLDADFNDLKNQIITTNTEVDGIKEDLSSLAGNTGNVDVGMFVDFTTTWAQGVIDGTSGANIQSNTRIRSNYIWASKIKLSPNNGAKWFAVIYDKNNNYVASTSWSSVTSVVDIESYTNAKSARIVLSNANNTNIDISYASNLSIGKKNAVMRSAMFRGTLEELGISELKNCVYDGYYTYNYQTSSGLDIPDVCKGASGIVEVFGHITASENDTVYQFVTSSSGITAFRWVRLNSDVKGKWELNDKFFKFNGTLESLGITDVDELKTDGYYTVKAVTAPSINNLPERFSASACTIQVYSNITTANQATWYQVAINSAGETAFRYIREYGTKGDWVYTKPKPDFKWFALGDSITEGYYSTGKNAMSVTQYNWVKYASELMGCTVTNYGIGGSGYMDNVHATDHKNAKQKVNDIDFSGADLVTLAWGVNDWKYGYPLGTMSDSVSAGESVISSMRQVIEKIISDNPYCKIVVITPLNCRGYDYDYGTESTNWGLGHVIPENGKTLQEFFNGIKEVCEYYGIEMIDNTHNSIVNRKTIIEMLKDGVHPSLECHKVLGHEIAKKINFA